MADIHLLGLGILTPDHVTRETERLLGSVNEVLTLDTGIATGVWLGSLCPRVTPLFAESYAVGQNRLSAYHHMAARVVDAALARAPVAFAIQGHPLVGVTAPRLIRRLADVLGLTVETQPGISALDCLLVELGLDPLVDGLQMVEATDMLLRRRPLDPTMPALVWQVGAVESVLYSRRRSAPRRFERLRAHLLRMYPTGHPVAALYASPHPLVPTERIEFALGQIGEVAERLHAGHTLWLPPAQTRAVADTALLREITDPAHLARITR